MFLWILFFLIGTCAADDNSSDVHVDTSLNTTGSLYPPVESIHSTFLTYTLTVYFANVSAGSSLKIFVITELNDTRVTLIHSVDGTDMYSTSDTLTVYAAGPAATVPVVLTRPDLNTKFGALVDWSLPSIEPSETHTVALTVDRPSYIAYQGYMGKTVKGGVVVSRPPGADLCISRPETLNAFESTMFVYSGDSITNNVYVGRLDKLLGCAGDRNTSLPDTLTIVAPYSVAIFDTPVLTLKTALSSYSLASFSPQLLNDGARTVFVENTPQTFLNSQPYNVSVLTTLSKFVFPDDDTSLQVWCGALYDNNSAEKYIIAEISKSSLDTFAYEGQFRALCRSLTLKASKGTVSVQVDSELKTPDTKRVVAYGSRGIITNFNYPFPEFSFKILDVRTLTTDDQSDMPFSLRFSKVANGTNVAAQAENTHDKEDQCDPVQVGAAWRVAEHAGLSGEDDFDGPGHPLPHGVRRAPRPPPSSPPRPNKRAQLRSAWRFLPPCCFYDQRYWYRRPTLFK